MASYFDEAFLLLGVLNMWNKVVFAGDLTPEQKDSLKHEETFVERMDENGKPRVLGYYTENIAQGERKDKEGSNGKPGGKSWSKEGMLKFVELKNKILEGRKNDKVVKRWTSFDKMIIEEHAAKLQRDAANRTSTKKRVREKVTVNEDKDILQGMADDAFCESMVKRLKKQRKFFRA